MVSLPTQAGTFSPVTVAELIAAINTANSNGEPDTIDLGWRTFTLTEPLEADGSDGLPLLLADGALTIRNGTIERDIAAEPFRLLNVRESAVLVLDHVTLRGGQANDAATPESPAGGGGGIFAIDASVTIRNSTLEFNSAGWGITGNDVIRNGGNGGAILVTGASAAALVIENSTFVGNIAGPGALGTGGDTGGNGGAGGAIYAAFGTVTVTNSTFSLNFAGNGGNGGDGDSGENGGSGGNGGNGGAIASVPTAGLQNVTLFANLAGFPGAGGAASPEIACELNPECLPVFGEDGNAGTGSQIYGGISAANSIIAGLEGDDTSACGGSVTTDEASMATDGSCDIAAVKTLEELDLCDLDFHGGPTMTIELMEDSHAIDAGGDSCPATDQRGVPRPVGEACDVGAYEAGASFDLGDAPDPGYPTLFASNGAAHVLGVEGAPFLGTAAPDAEDDGQPNDTATGDDTDADGDDEGSVSVTSFTSGTATPVTVTVSGVGEIRGNAWIDFNRDGDFDDDGEQVANNLEVAGGSYGFVVTIPAAAPTGRYYARMRVCSTDTTCNTPRGIAADGEVEDHAITVSSPGGGLRVDDDDDDDCKTWEEVLTLGLCTGSSDPLTLWLFGLFGLWRVVRRG